LEQGADRELLADALVAEYCISRTTALEDVDDFYETLVRAGCAEP
jgi:hypothetical protein